MNELNIKQKKSKKVEDIKIDNAVKYCSNCGAVGEKLHSIDDIKMYFPEMLNLYNMNTGKLNKNFYICSKTPCICNGHKIYPYFCNIKGCHEHEQCMACDYWKHCLDNHND